jgi:hypothetical protein
MPPLKRRFTNFSIEAILEKKKLKVKVEDHSFIKQERSESPSSTTVDFSLDTDSMAVVRQSSILCQSPSVSWSSTTSFAASSPSSSPSLIPSKPNSFSLVDPMPKKHKEVPAHIQQIHGDHFILVVPSLALPDHGRDGDIVLVLLPVQAAGEGLVVE